MRRESVPRATTRYQQNCRLRLARSPLGEVVLSRLRAIRGHLTNGLFFHEVERRSSAARPTEVFRRRCDATETGKPYGNRLSQRTRKKSGRRLVVSLSLAEIVPGRKSRSAVSAEGRENGGKKNRSTGCGSSSDFQSLDAPNHRDDSSVHLAFRTIKPRADVTFRR